MGYSFSFIEGGRRLKLSRMYDESLLLNVRRRSLQSPIDDGLAFRLVETRVNYSYFYFDVLLYL